MNSRIKSTLEEVAEDVEEDKTQQDAKEPSQTMNNATGRLDVRTLYLGSNQKWQIETSRHKTVIYILAMMECCCIISFLLIGLLGKNAGLQSLEINSLLFLICLVNAAFNLFSMENCKNFHIKYENFCDFEKSIIKNDDYLAPNDDRAKALADKTVRDYNEREVKNYSPILLAKYIHTLLFVISLFGCFLIGTCIIEDINVCDDWSVFSSIVSLIAIIIISFSCWLYYKD